MEPAWGAIEENIERERRREHREKEREEEEEGESVLQICNESVTNETGIWIS